MQAAGLASMAALLAVTLVPLAWAAEATKVEISGRQLLVNGEPFHMKGVCWNPVPKGGTHPAHLNYEGFVETDAELMASAGINVVRTYEALNNTQVLDVLWEHSIYVLNTVYISGQYPVESLVSSVELAKDHPAVLMWIVGNEWNYNGLYFGLPLEESQQRVAEAVRLIKDTDPTRPVATVYGELPSKELLDSLGDVDVWGINKYDGDSFGDLFASWAELSDKPMFLGEYGADAYNTDTGKEDEEAQAAATVKLTTEIINAGSADKDGVCVGGVIFELADEWWKDSSGNPGKHDVGGISPGGGPYPDRTFNEEWWGLVRSDGQPREAFKAYASIQVPGGPELDAAKVAEVLDAKPPLREKACGAKLTCRGLFGNCCPSDNGTMAPCCHAKHKQKPAEKKEEASTTWKPPKVSEGSTHSEGPKHKYVQKRGSFAGGLFKADLPGCQGVGECQFKTRRHAQHWCDAEPTCTAVLLHPFEDNCAGGFGCYTPRSGNVSQNVLWDRSGGKSWVKGEASEDAGGTPQEAGGAVGYAFVGFAPPDKVGEACSAHSGRPAMPKTKGQQEALLHAMDTAQAAGKMSKTWPRNTIWLGARWSEAEEEWQWLDGTPIEELSWAPGQPSAKGEQDKEPWLCMADVSGGAMHDSETGEPPYEFGVMCEGVPEDEAVEDDAPPLVGSEMEAMDDAEATAAAGERAGDAQQAQEEQGHEGAPAAEGVEEDSEDPEEPVEYGGYVFVGFHGPEDARRACGEHRRLAMPKTSDERKALLEAVDSALEGGSLRPKWPRNTIWLGGRWDSASDSWRWDDGDNISVSEVKWGEGQPSASDHQQDEPWLCMVHEADDKRPVVHDSDAGPPYKFGVLCQPAEADAAGGPPDEPSSAEVTPETTTLEARESPAPAEAPEHTPAPAAEEPEDAPGQASDVAFKFVGWERPSRAREVCKDMGRLAMPKTDAEKKQVLQAIKAAIAAGDMDEEWPRNAAWLAGRWNRTSKRWEWDDSDEIPQLSGNKAAKLDSASKPWLCVSADGQARAWDDDELGVICQLSGSAARLRGLAAEPAVTWVRGAPAMDCDLACAEAGLLCAEGSWPRSRDEFERTVLPSIGQRCLSTQSGGHRYDPSASGRHCGWQGPDEQSHWRDRRCGAPAPRGTARLCPCAGTPFPALDTSAIWS